MEQKYCKRGYGFRKVVIHAKDDRELGTRHSDGTDSVQRSADDSYGEGHQGEPEEAPGRVQARGSGDCAAES